MIYVVLAIIVIVLLAVGYVLSTRCGGSHPWLRKMRRFAYAHRGLHDESKPENSMSAFRAAVAQGYGIELDVHLLKDGTLAVIHDGTLLRTTGQEGKVEELDAQDLWNYRLEGTQELIPTFREVLDMVNGRVPLIIELKCVNNNYDALCRAVCERLDQYKGLYCMESFDPRCVRWLKKNRPELIRGQLAENFVAAKGPLPLPVKLMLTLQLENFLNMPDFVAFKYVDRKNLGNFLVRRLWKLESVTWTVRSQEDLDIAEKEGYIPIFEGFRP